MPDTSHLISVGFSPVSILPGLRARPLGVSRRFSTLFLCNLAVFAVAVLNDDGAITGEARATWLELALPFPSQPRSEFPND